jgi:Flp pilus assembly protein TadG
MRRARGERGQILAVVVLALVALLGIAAFSIDVGYAYYAKRQLQSATDAAALAGAQDLPAASTAIDTAKIYAQDNSPSNLSTLTFTYQTKCTTTTVMRTGCDAATHPNALVVTGTGTTETWFAKVFGIDHFNVSAHANACSPCSVSPVDIVIAIDRTGSMCDNGGTSCTDLDNAKDGVRTMLKLFNPPSAEIGMIAFPPLESTKSNPCDPPSNSGGGSSTAYDSPNRGYVTDIVNGGYRDAKETDGLNHSSGLYLHTQDGPKTSCIQSDGNTSYSEALRQAQAELIANGRPDVPDYIVFLTDGEANIGSVYGMNDPVYYPGNDDDSKPCHTASKVADDIKKTGTTIYSIGYALGTLNCTGGIYGTLNPKYDPKNPGAEPRFLLCTPAATGCRHYAKAFEEEGPINSYDTVKAIASEGNFSNKASPGDLDAIFAKIAADIAQGSSRLVDDNF